MHALLRLPWLLLRLLNRTIAALLIALGVVVVVACAGYFEFESIVEAIDSRYADRIDA